ncbi:deacylase, partial [Vibrio parahaemolyticus]|nr:deacylase [Vibrio parahaemolyticus]
APKRGLVIGQQTLPLVNEGDAIFHLAYFNQGDNALEQAVESYIEGLTEFDAEPLTTGQIPLETQ